MTEVITIVLPIFTLMAIGYISSYAGVFGKFAGVEINNFVIYIGLPSLLFVLVIDAEMVLDEYFAFALLFFSSTLVVFICFLAYRTYFLHDTTKATLEAFCASYSNTGFMGIPLCLIMFGEAGSIPAIIATIITACIFLLITMMIIEFTKSDGKEGIFLFVKLLRVFKNPVIAAPAVALFFSYFEIAISIPIYNILKMLGDASIVMALFSIGLFLHSTHNNNATTSLDLVLTKNIFHPLVTAFFAILLFELSTTLTIIAIMLSMLPIGTGPFMIATLYGVSLQKISRGILASTLLSVVTVPLFIWVYINFLAV